MGNVVSNHKKLFKPIIEASFLMGQKIEERTVDSTARTGHANMKQIIEDSFKEYNNESRQFLQKIWEEFDENKDGVLDKNECLRLTTECLNAQIQYVPGHIGQSVGKMLEVMAEKHNASDEVRRSIKARVSQTKAEATKVLQSLLSNVEQLSTDIFIMMDNDNTGDVSKEEFLEHYLRAGGEVLSLKSE